MVWSEHVPCFFGRALQNNNHEGTHKECTIDHFVCLFRRAVVEDPIIGVVFVAQQTCQLA